MIVNEEKEREYLKEIAENHNVSFEQLWNDFTKSELTLQKASGN